MIHFCKKKFPDSLQLSAFHYTETYCLVGSVFSSCLYCSWAVYWMAAYGTMRTIVAEFPRHSCGKPSFCFVLLMKSRASFHEKGLFDTVRKVPVKCHFIEGDFQTLYGSSFCRIVSLFQTAVGSDGKHQRVGSEEKYQRVWFTGKFILYRINGNLFHC